jgi:hypothetical protein
MCNRILTPMLESAPAFRVWSLAAWRRLQEDGRRQFAQKSPRQVTEMFAGAFVSIRQSPKNLMAFFICRICSETAITTGFIPLEFYTGVGSVASVESGTVLLGCGMV